MIMLGEKILGVLVGFGIVGFFIFWWVLKGGRKYNGVFIGYFELVFLFLLLFLSVLFSFLEFIFVI